MVLDAPQAVGVGHHDLAGGHIPQMGGAHRVQSAALAGEDVAAPRQSADAQGPVAPGVTDGDQLGGGHDHQAVGALQLIHGGGHCLLDALVLEAVAGEQIADHLGVGGAVEDGAVVFQLVAQLDRVGQVAVVAQGHGAPAVADNHGLGVGPHPAAGGGVAHMAGGHVGLGLAHRSHHLGGEHLVHQPQVPVAGDDAVLVDGHAAAFLAPVLQGVQGRIHGHRHILGAGFVVDAEDTALLVEGISKIRHSDSF